MGKKLTEENISMLIYLHVFYAATEMWNIQ